MFCNIRKILKVTEQKKKDEISKGMLGLFKLIALIYSSTTLPASQMKLSAKETIRPVMFVSAWIRSEWKAIQSSWESTPMLLFA